jgi:hypothetical protein
VAAEHDDVPAGPVLNLRRSLLIVLGLGALGMIVFLLTLYTT